MTLKPPKPLHVFLFLLLALLTATLIFPPTREAHSLCLRLLLHLKDNTHVLARIFHRGIEQRSGEGVKRVDITHPNENITHRFLCDRL